MYNKEVENENCWKYFSLYCERDIEGEKIFVTTYSSRLYTYIKNAYEFGREESKDLLQETWIKALSANIKKLNRENCEGYLYTIAKSVCLDVMRKKNRQKRIPEDQTVDWHTVANIVQNMSNNETNSKYQIQTYQEELSKLPEKQRKALIHHLNGYSTKEIAQITNSKFEAVRTRIRMAKDKLREILHPVKKQ